MTKEYKDVLRLRVVFKGGFEERVEMRCNNPAEVWDELRENLNNLDTLHAPKTSSTSGFWLRLSEVQHITPI